MHYGLIGLAVVLFSGGFALNDVYQKKRGGSLKACLQFSLISSLVGLLILLAVNAWRLEYPRLKPA